MIAVVFALAFEAAGFRESRPGVHTLILGRAGSMAVGILEQSMARHGKPEAVILAGLAGGLDPSLQVGDQILFVPGNGGKPGDAARAIRVPPWREGAIITIPRIAGRASEKQALHKKTGGAACDMETASVSAFCDGMGIPFLTLRAISDTADRDLPVSSLINPRTGKPDVAGLVFELARHPKKIPAFAGMLADAKTARDNLASGLRVLLDAIGTA